MPDKNNFNNFERVNDSERKKGSGNRTILQRKKKLNIHGRTTAYNQSGSRK